MGSGYGGPRPDSDSEFPWDCQWVAGAASTNPPLCQSATCPSSHPSTTSALTSGCEYPVTTTPSSPWLRSRASAHQDQRQREPGRCSAWPGAVRQLHAFVANAARPLDVKIKPRNDKFSCYIGLSARVTAPAGPPLDLGDPMARLTLVKEAVTLCAAC